MKSDIENTADKIRRYLLCIFGVSAYLALVLALFASAMGLDLNNVRLS